MSTTELTRRERRNLRKLGLSPEEFVENRMRANLGNLRLKPTHPMTDNQELAFEAYESNKNLLLHGIAGTGKTYLSLYLGLNEVLNSQTKDQLVIIRSVVPSRDMGFLPGSAKEKARGYELPYTGVCNELFGRGDAYDLLKNRGVVDFTTTSFLRGITIDNAVILVDEIQNMVWMELDTIMTRIGKNSRIIFSGDFRQTDLTLEKDKAGLKKFMEILAKLTSFSYVEFTEQDILRSGIVREYIIQRTARGF
jgi:phosphate starvation-inducible protein PhoH